MALTGAERRALRVDEPSARDTGVIMVVLIPAVHLCAAEVVRRWR
jgi:hypothetical protein